MKYQRLLDELDWRNRDTSDHSFVGTRYNWVATLHKYTIFGELRYRLQVTADGIVAHNETDTDDVKALHKAIKRKVEQQNIAERQNAQEAFEFTFLREDTE